MQAIVSFPIFLERETFKDTEAASVCCDRTAPRLRVAYRRISVAGIFSRRAIGGEIPSSRRKTHVTVWLRGPRRDSCWNLS